MKLQILPYPKKYYAREGYFSLTDCTICIMGCFDYRIVKAALRLKNTLQIKTKSFHKFSLSSCVNKNSITVLKDNKLDSEEYKLDISSESIKIIGGDDAGCFYGIETLLQILDANDDLKIPALLIEDKPDMKYRGFYHDATRGRVPTVDGVKRIIDFIAGYKINSFQLYIEHTFEFDEFKDEKRTSNDYLTAEELIEIDNYCYDNFIDFIPSLSTFGHLYHLLSTDKYKHLCELENYTPQKHHWRERMAHHTIDPTNPESIEVICSLIDQYLPLFRSKYFNICCDETFDLCRGRNVGKDSGKLYCEFVEKIAKHVTSHGKKVMMWSDIALKYENALENLPKDTILLNWDYDAAPNLDSIKKINKYNIPQIVCPGTSSWKRFIECPQISIPNITKMAKCGYENHAIGILNTNWGDEGHLASFECSLYGITVGACIGWNIKTKMDESFERTVSRSVYKANTNIVDIIKKISHANNTINWVGLFDWNRENKELIYLDIPEAQANICECNNIINILSEIAGDNQILAHLVVAAKGIALINQAIIYLLKEEYANTKAWKKDAEAWFKEYETLWLEGCKKSELDGLKKIIINIL